MRLGVRTTAEADEQALAAENWWISNRPSAHALFAEELSEALSSLGRFPKLGRPYRVRGVTGVRRLYLQTTRYHVYYVHDPEAHEIVVLAIWSAVRGEGPPLGRP